jgi:hypothetical protein
LPHVHAPPEEQPSPVAPHDWQALPRVAHAVPDVAVQTLPVQQPVGHEFESQTQLPPMHSCPAEHALPAPHRQAPAGEQLSEYVLSHATHALPSVPQLPMTGARHVLPEQHPVGHDVELHTHAPLEQIWPAAHGPLVPHMHDPPVQRSADVVEHTVHAAPPVPHVEGAAV